MKPENKEVGRAGFYKIYNDFRCMRKWLKQSMVAKEIKFTNLNEYNLASNYGMGVLVATTLWFYFTLFFSLIK